LNALARATAALVAGSIATAAAAEAPLRVRNVSPVAQLYGMPRAMGAELVESGYELSFGTEIANNFTSDLDGTTFAFFDGETTVFSYGARGALADGWEWGVEIPFVDHDGGYLDAAVDNFHDIFGFDDNGRERANRNQIDYFIRYRGETYVDFQDETDDWGDVRASLGYQLARDDTQAWAVRALLKLPTGEVEHLTGSDATDLALWVEHARSSLFGQARMSLSAALGAMWLGDGDLVPQRQESFAGYGHLGLAWRMTEAVSLLGQVDYHSRLIDSGLDHLGGRGLQGTLGARFRYKERLTTEFSFVEDLTSDSVADVAFQLLIAARM
jgi:hypothetical protein